MKIIKAAAIALLATTLLTGNAHASSGNLGDFWGKVVSFLHNVKEKVQERREGGEGPKRQFEGFTHRHFNGCHGSGGNGHQVPEMDAAGAGIALGLLGGLAALRRERKNAKKLPDIG